MLRSTTVPNNTQSRRENGQHIFSKRSGRPFGATDAIRLLIIPAVTLFVLTTITMHHILSTGDDYMIEVEESLKESLSRIFDPTIPRFDEMADFGDKSRAYRKLRFEYDNKFPAETIKDRASFVEKLWKREYKPILSDETIGYDVFNCPGDPPEGYPAAFNMLSVLDNWGPDDPTPHTQIYQGICVFDYNTEYETALRYREKEVPFVIRGDPAVLRTVERWNEPEYLRRVLGEEKHRAEYSENNHFMYWNAPRRGKKKGKKRQNKAPQGWTAPTKNIRMTYGDWLSKANVTDDKLGPNNPHWYFRLIGCGLMGSDCDKGNSELLYDELTFFQPRPESTLYMVVPEEQKGIHCRFGMKGVIAENHYDGSRNMIALLGGERRYIMAHPNQCEKLCLYPKGHPSGRHSEVDWSNPDLEKFPIFKEAQVNEIVLQAGDVLYLPTDWFHYIISLEMNWQCNTRSGITNDYKRDLRKCGF